jgi:E3 ubiquitin-protein ligase BRE1
MESRKRLGSESSVASSSRPTKRLATDSDQPSPPVHTDPFSYENLAFLTEYRKEAIYRSLLAERRDKSRLSERIQQYKQQSVFHDDHIRVIDLWLKQLLEELAVSYGKPESLSDGKLSCYVQK